MGAMTKKVIAPTERKEKEQPEMNLHKMNSVTKVSSLSFSSAGKGQFLTGITIFFETTYIVLVNLQEVSGSKSCCLLLLEVVNFTSYHLIRRTL